ncbi:two component transcriptional regulator, LuxR family [Cnuella takakiae]|uniref:Two component transcriptional regulator, LuxR family n=1 Tax=Cnuella takakiae TaxID=1302690 RepID=A0A1M4SSU8_9BACT|nr:response regulator transcription factor [Cnuella takakiae]OLY90582.1 hypothetical protein BUE76_00655 [Cnuella takakiae]SHE35077.1 two component transcriptional regulator, LuxR family [Cnuella takakiae]
MKKIIIADDHTIVRVGMRQLIQESYPFCNVVEVDNADDLVRRVLAEDWDAVVTDITMPGKTGIDALIQIRQVKPKLPVLVLTLHSEDAYALRAMRAGASGYLTKTVAAVDLVDALERIITGKNYITEQVAEIMVSAIFNPEGKVSKDLLTDREMEVLLLVAKGKKVREGAALLHISASSFATYRSRVMEKLQLFTVPDLVRFCLEEHLL